MHRPNLQSSSHIQRSFAHQLLQIISPFLIIQHTTEVCGCMMQTLTTSVANTFLFLVAVLVFLFIFLLLLLFGQWLQAISHLRLFSLVNSARLKPFMDSYHAPTKQNIATGLDCCLCYTTTLHFNGTSNFINNSAGLFGFNSADDGNGGDDSRPYDSC